MSAGCPGTAAATKRIRAPAGVWRVNRRETWEEVAVPELRIVSDELWEAVRRRQAALRFAVTRDQDGHATNRAHRRAFLLSGVLTRGCCGGLYTIMAKDRCELTGIERRLEGCVESLRGRRLTSNRKGQGCEVRSNQPLGSHQRCNRI